MIAGIGIAQHQDFVDRFMKETRAGQGLVIVLDFGTKDTTEFDQYPGLLTNRLQALDDHQPLGGVEMRQDGPAVAIAGFDDDIQIARLEFEHAAKTGICRASQSIAVIEIGSAYLVSAHRTPPVKLATIAEFCVRIAARATAACRLRIACSG